MEIPYSSWATAAITHARNELNPEQVDSLRLGDLKTIIGDLGGHRMTGTIAGKLTSAVISIANAATILNLLKQLLFVA